MNTRQEKVSIALFVPSLCYGGAERQVIEIARHLDRERFDVHILTLIDFSPLLEPDDELHQRVHIVERPGGFDPMLLFRVRRLLKKLDVRIVHSFLFLPEFLARLAAPFAGKPVVIGSERNTDYQLAFYRWFCLRMTSRLSDLIVANSRAGAAFNAGYFNRSQGQYRVLYNGVDTDRFKPGGTEACRRSINAAWTDETAVIGMFGSFKRQKNHVYLFQALAAARSRRDLGDIVLLLVGDTLVEDHDDTLTYKREVQRALKEHALEDITVVLGNRTAVEAVYVACDFTVLPSLHEGTPNVVLESMACGVPAVVTDVSDNAILVTHEVDGMVVPLNDVEAFSGVLEEMIRNRELRENLGLAARDRMLKDFSLSAMARNAAEIYEEVLAW